MSASFPLVWRTPLKSNFLSDEIVGAPQFRKRAGLGEGDFRKLGDSLVGRNMAFEIGKRNRGILGLLASYSRHARFRPADYWFLDRLDLVNGHCQFRSPHPDEAASKTAADRAATRFGLQPHVAGFRGPRRAGHSRKRSSMRPSGTPTVNMTVFPCWASGPLRHPVKSRSSGQSAIPRGSGRYPHWFHPRQPGNLNSGESWWLPPATWKSGTSTSASDIDMTQRAAEFPMR